MLRKSRFFHKRESSSSGRSSWTAWQLPVNTTKHPRRLGCAGQLVVWINEEQSSNSRVIHHSVSCTKNFSQNIGGGSLLWVWNRKVSTLSVGLVINIHWHVWLLLTTCKISANGLGKTLKYLSQILLLGVHYFSGFSSCWMKVPWVT
jgi:hypothetical protein